MTEQKIRSHIRANQGQLNSEQKSSPVSKSGGSIRKAVEAREAKERPSGIREAIESGEAKERPSGIREAIEAREAKERPSGIREAVKAREAKERPSGIREAIEARDAKGRPSGIREAIEAREAKERPSGIKDARRKIERRAEAKYSVEKEEKPKPETKLPVEKKTETKPESGVFSEKKAEIRPEQKLPDEKKSEVKPMSKLPEQKKEETKPEPGTDTKTEEKPAAESNRLEKRRRDRRSRKMLLLAGVILMVLFLGYAGMAGHYNDRFLPGTKINGEDCGGKTAAQVEKELAGSVLGYKLTLVGKNDLTDVIYGKDIALQYQPGNTITSLLKKQNSILWFTGIFGKKEIESKLDVSFDEEKLNKIFETLALLKEENQEPSKNARPTFDGKTFTIAEEVYGTQIKEETFQKAVDTSIHALNKTLNLEQAGCYKKPKFKKGASEVAKARDEMISYLKASITYNLYPGTETVTAEQIGEWLTVDKNMEVQFDKDKLADYVEQLAGKCNTVGGQVEFQAADGETVTLKGYDIGWRVNEEAEMTALMDNIRHVVTITRDPEYSSTMASHVGGGVGKTYAEVDLTDQHMWYFKDGSLVLECDVVTGNPNKGNETPDGIYKLDYKQKDRVLRGQKDKEGNYEYETPVKYWMPFNGGIGFHDASWQASFGGKRYQTNGSHGCVNMPPEVAKQLYDIIQKGDTVVVHK